VRGERTGAVRLAELRDELSGRDVAILDQVNELRFMTGGQIEAIHFAPNGQGSTDSAARAARRVLERLTDERLLLRLERRIGGTRAGSASFVYLLGPVGHRLLDLPGRRRPYREPGGRFVRHTLTVTQLVVELTLAHRRRHIELLTVQSEPRCWRRMLDRQGAPATLRPDLFLTLAADDTEYRWFVEVDLGNEHIETLLRKCEAYQTYYRSGTEQAEDGVFPRVLWLMHNDRRVEQLREAVGRQKSLTPGLFTVTQTERALDIATGGTP
jgi:hypothetical protein